MSRIIDLSGEKFGRLKVIKRHGYKIYKSGRKFVQWLCECDCGNKEVYCTSNALKSGLQSCGCFMKEVSAEKARKLSKTHGKSNTRLYRIWSGMKERCYREKHMWYENYGGRGIAICDEWLNDFQSFYDWAMNNGYQDHLTIDRIDSDRNYESSNCRWVTEKEQQNNLRKTVYVELNNKKYTITELAEEYNLDRNLVWTRYYSGKRGLDLVKPKEIKMAKKQSGVKGIKWSEKGKSWVVNGVKNGKKDSYICMIKDLDEAIKFKQTYDKEQEVYNEIQQLS